MQNLQNELINILQHEDALVVDGQLNKNKIVEMALQVDPKLIKHLIKHDTFKTHFFTEVEGVLVFDKIRFQRFVNNKSFLPDSYTAFKNKIGLTINDGTTDNYITTKNDVVLAWPHKDCVLEGGQTKEDQKRNEIFWNETLAPDEIDRLLDPKVFINWKKYDQKGEHDVKEISDNDNLIIKGNNLLALASLKKRYAGKVKLIYIDPPYNTGNDSFLYNDSFNHSSWLSFMKNRLILAKQLLRNDGLLFVQINENEQAYLSILLDELFGKECYEASICVKMAHLSGPKMAHKERNIPKVKEYILMYSKNPDLVKLNPQYIEVSWDDAFYRYQSFIDKSEGENEIEKWKPISLKQAYKKFNIDENNNDAVFDFNIKNASKIYQTAINRSKDYPKEPHNIFLKIDDKIVLNGRELVFASEKMMEIKGKQKPSSIISDIWTDIGINNVFQEGGKEISLRFGKKPEMLLQRIIALTTNEDDLVLDFFVGSGTTCAVAHKMRRKYIGIEQLDYIEPIPVSRLKSVIGTSEIKKSELLPSINYDQSGVSKEVDWKGGGSFIYCELAKYNQTYADQILEADSKEKLIEVWQEMKEKAFLSYQFDKQSFDERIDAFKTLSLDDQKKFLLEVLDKNQLYVNYSEIADETHGISKEDKWLNDMFYGKI